MAFKIITKSIAYSDLGEAILWYEKKSPGLGRRFLQKIEDAKTKILERPTAFSYVKHPVR